MEKNLELLEQFPTGWIVVDDVDVSLFNDKEIKLIIEFNESKGRRCTRRPERAITAEEITNKVLLRLLTNVQKTAQP